MIREDVANILDVTGTKHNWIAKKIGITTSQFSRWINGDLKVRLNLKQEEALETIVNSLKFLK